MIPKGVIAGSGRPFLFLLLQDLLDKMFHFQEKKFLRATRVNDTNQATKLIRTGLKNINYCDHNSNTGLLFAVKNDNEFLVKEILSHGGNINVKNTNGFTPLILATINGQLNIILILRQLGANDDEQFKAYLRFNNLINGKKDVVNISPDIIDTYGFNNYSAQSFTKFLLHLSKNCGVPPPRLSVGQGVLRYTNRVAQYQDGMILLNKIEGSYSRIIAGALVHEFAHYYIDLKQLQWLDGSDLNKHEYLVDTAAIYLGFGQILLMGKEYSFHPENSSTVQVKVGYLSYEASLEAYNYFRIIHKLIEL